MMKKAFDQTVRDLKRGVNKKVLKVPTIEQKILDATSNEPWGPHGTLLADIAQASRNFNDYQMIMTVIWKRINDTGKKWRHVFKALTVLEYLVAHGSERVIDDIKEHSYQISTLSDFQYIDSSGRDQGSNVRRKSQNIVALVNNKKRVAELREKSLMNKEKYRSASSIDRPGSSYPSSGSLGDLYEDDRASRDDERYTNGKEKEGGHGEDDRYSRNSDIYSRDSDRCSRDSDGSYYRDSYKEESYRRGHQSSFDGEDVYSSRNSRRADETSQEERQFESKPSNDAPPSYEEATRGDSNHFQEENDRNVDNVAVPDASSSQHGTSSPSANANEGLGNATEGASPLAQDIGNFSHDDFDPRGVVSDNADDLLASSSLNLDFFGSAAAADPVFSLSMMPSGPTSVIEADATENVDFGADFAAPSTPFGIQDQSANNPFEDPPFKATPDYASHQQESTSTSLHSSTPTAFSGNLPSVPSNSQEVYSGFDFGDTFAGLTYMPNFANEPQSVPANSSSLYSQMSTTQPSNGVSGHLLPANVSSLSIPSQPVKQEAPVQMQMNFPSTQPNNGVPGYLPPVKVSAHSNPTQSVKQEVPVQMQMNFPTTQPNNSVPGYMPPVNVSAHSIPTQSVKQEALVPMQMNFPATQQNNDIPGYLPPVNVSAHSIPTQSVKQEALVPMQMNFPLQQGNVANFTDMSSDFFRTQASNGISGAPQPGSMAFGNLQANQAVAPGYMQANLVVKTTSSPVSSAYQPTQFTTSTPTKALTPVKQMAKFSPKSTVWADTFSRGLINLDISGSKTNPHSELGIDFDAMNRKERRTEEKKSPITPAVSSTVTMGKAMGSGSGMGRAGASAMAAPVNSMMNSGMGMGMNMGGYGGGMTQQPSMGMGMNHQPMMSMGGAYGGNTNHHQPMGMGGGYGGGMNNQQMSMGMNMNMNMNMRPSPMGGMQPSGGANMNMPTYNPTMMMNMVNNYNPQQPYGGGGGYR